MNTPKNVWVLGGTGFIGTALTKRLLNNSEYALNLLLHKRYPGKVLESCNTFVGSLESFELAWMQQYPPDIIFHLARMGGRNRLIRYRASHKGANANQQLIDFLLKEQHQPIVVYVSGSLMYGHQEDGNPIDEFAKIFPVSYARTYVTAELPWIDIQEKKMLDVRFARPGWIVGPDSWFKAFYWNHYKKNGTVPLYGSGENLMSIVDVDDCVAQIVGVAERGKPNCNLNIVTGQPLRQIEFVNTLAGLLNSRIEKISIKKLHWRFGKASAEAFESSIPMKTCFPEIAGGQNGMYVRLEDVLQKTISLLKDKQSIFAKLP